MAKTVGDLKAVRAELVERRRLEAYLLGGASHDERIKLLASLQMAIQAIDAVIAEGRDAPHADLSGSMRPR
jgi:hypothetical protein